MASLKDYIFSLAQLPGNEGGSKLDFGVSSTGIAWIKLGAINGTTVRYFFINNAGTLKVHTAEPTADGDGSAV